MSPAPIMVSSISVGKLSAQKRLQPFPTTYSGTVCGDTQYPVLSKQPFKVTVAFFGGHKAAVQLGTTAGSNGRAKGGHIYRFEADEGLKMKLLSRRLKVSALKCSPVDVLAVGRGGGY